MRLRTIIAMSALLLCGCKIDTQAQPNSGADVAAKKASCPDGSMPKGAKPCPTSPAPTTPPPTTVATSSPNGLSGETPVSDNFDTNLALEASAAPGVSGDAVGGFRMTCVAGQLLKDDPIVYPGQPGASHLHQFWGNTGANANSTYQSLRTTGQTTCGDPNAPVNRTAYWMPAMLDGAGHAVKPDTIQIYYKQLPAGGSACTASATACVGLPNGIRMVFGYNMKTMTGGPNDPGTMDYYTMNYQCWKDVQGTPAVNGGFHTIADLVKAGCPAGSLLVISFTVPGCWDGKNLDSADHRSHLSYGTPETGGQICPASHPYLISAWQGNVRFTTDANFAAGKWHLASDEMMPGTIAGSTLHFDYFEAWSPAVKDTWQTRCIDAHLTCADGQLGNGTKIKGITVPPPHQLVPVG